MKKPASLFAIILLLPFSYLVAQSARTPNGSLFIIGGGDRSPSIMKALLRTANPGPTDYVAVLPMSSEEPDSSFFYFKMDMQPVCSNALVYMNFTRADVNDKRRLDSLEHAKLIFITGGDQERFMNVVLHTPVYDAIHHAYDNGATVAGTSAGAALMPYHMITGREYSDTTYRATFRKLHDQNIEIKEGLGLIKHAIIDQHFVVRSRYNRLLSALAKFPDYPCIGIDEATAVIVKGNRATVAGDSQVLVFRNTQPPSTTAGGLVKLKDVRLSIYTAGESFALSER